MKKEQKVGYDFIGVGVGAIVFNNQGRVFLAQRGPQARNEQGTWEFPGGSVEFGETLRDAIKREFLEEFEMIIEIEELLNVSDHILPQERQHWVSPTFIGRHIGGTPHIAEPQKCSAIGWFSLTDLPQPLSIVTQDDVKCYRARGHRFKGGV